MWKLATALRTNEVVLEYWLNRPFLVSCRSMYSQVSSCCTVLISEFIAFERWWNPHLLTLNPARQCQASRSQTPKTSARHSTHLMSPANLRQMTAMRRREILKTMLRHTTKSRILARRREAWDLICDIAELRTIDSLSVVLFFGMTNPWGHLRQVVYLRCFRHKTS